MRWRPSNKTRLRGRTLAQGDGVALIRPDNPPLRAIAQFVTAEAARKLLAVTEPFDRPIDTFLQMSWVTGVELLALTPSGVRDASAALGGSTIQARSKPLGQRLAREIGRPLYRAQVRLWHALAKTARRCAINVDHLQRSCVHIHWSGFRRIDFSSSACIAAVAA